jgi:ATP-dependent Clp protease ATP-binding subunit ClpX
MILSTSYLLDRVNYILDHIDYNITKDGPKTVFIYIDIINKLYYNSKLLKNTKETDTAKLKEISDKLNVVEKDVASIEDSDYMFYFIYKDTNLSFEEKEDKMDSLRELIVGYSEEDEEEESNTVKLLDGSSPNLIPSDLVAGLDEYVIGQEDLKKTLAVHVANHFNSVNRSRDSYRQGLLIIGESGTGKTLAIQSLSKVLDKHVKIVDITQYSKEGYVGKSISSIAKEILIECNGDRERAMESIIFIDEVDKLASNIDMDEAVQDALLKFLEGGEYHFELGRSEDAQLDLGRACFILGGAFTKIHDQKKKELEGSKVGFENNLTKKKIVKDIKLNHEDLIKYGMKRELIGRIGHIVQTTTLTESSWYDIITKPKNCIKEHYDKLFVDNGIDDKVTSADVKAIVKKSKDMKLGVRGLWSVAATLFRDRLYY